MAIGRRANPNSYFGRLTLLKKLIWLYFFLLILEGALRKWVVPQLSAPLLIIRDPLSLMIIWEAYRAHKWPGRWSVVTALLTAGFVALFVVQIVVGNNPWFVGLYGLRSYLLPFPVMFIVGANFDREDLNRMCACTLWMLLPMTILEVAEYLAPIGSFLNKATAEGGRQISYVIGHVRPAGTFSFSVGAVSFGVLAAAFLFYGLVKDRLIKKWLLWASAFALILSVPVLGARTLLYELGAILGCVGIGAMFGLSQFGKTLKVLLPLLIIGGLASFLPVFSEAMNSLNTRLTQAAAEEGDSQQALLLRTITPIAGAFEEADFSNNWIGHGMGRGATAMAVLLTGRTEFTFGEGELSREIAELGPLPATIFFLFRLVLAVMILGRALAKARDHEPLALLLVPLSVSALLWCTTEQPTEQGFMVLSMGLTLAALNLNPVPVLQALPAVRQRLSNRPNVRRSWRTV